MAIINGRGRVGIRRSGAVAAASYLLDTYSGSAVAYSLRKLSLAYSGSAIRVRRSSDNAEQNIGFDASGNLDTTALTSFVGAGNGFVTTWYDQSGNGKHVTQTTATSQPQIVSSGTIYTKNGKPSIFWDNATSNKIMVSSTSVSLTELTIASVIFPIKKGYYDKVFTIGLDLTTTGIGYAMFAGGDFSDWRSNECLIYGKGYSLNQPPKIVTNGQLHPNNILTHTFATLGASNTKGFFNNNEISSYRIQTNGTVNVGDGIVRLGNGSSLSQQFGGYMQELILFSTNKISDRSSISSNQNTYYSIYNTVFPQWNLNSIDGSLFLSALQNDTKSFNTGSTTNIGTDFGTSIKWEGGVLAPNGYIYGIPANATQVLKIDPTTNTTSLFGGLSGTYKWFGGVLAPNGKIYGIPYTSTSILCIDPTTDTATRFGTVSGTGTYKWGGGVLAPNGKIYCIPAEATTSLVIDPVTSGLTYINITSGTGTYKWLGGVLAPNGKIYCIPNDSSNVAVINTSDDTISYISGAGSSTNKWGGGVLAPNGKIYCIPLNSIQVLVIDPSNDTISFINGAGSSSINKWYGGVLAPNGKIYGVPYWGTTTTMLEIDPTTNTLTTLGSFPATNGKWASGVLAPNGKIYFIPESYNYVRVIGDTQTMDNNRVLSRYMNKF